MEKKLRKQNRKKKKIKFLHKRRWNSLTPKQKSLRVKALEVLAEMRNSESKTLGETARKHDIKPRQVIQHTNGFKKTNGRWAAKKWDRIERVMKINSKGREKTVKIIDSRTASVVGKYHNSVKQFLNTGNKAKLARFKNRKVKDSSGKLHKLETDPDAIIRINERREDNEFFEVYQR